MTPTVLRTIAIDLVQDSDEQKLYHQSANSKRNQLVGIITFRWVEYFTVKQNLVIRRHVGKHAVSPGKGTFLRKTVAFHLVMLKRGFKSELFHEDLNKHADETHFSFRMDNGRTIGFRGDECFKYADVVSGNEGIKMMVRLAWKKNARLETPILVFKILNCAYPIQGVADEFPGVFYRSGIKKRMDGLVFVERLTA